MAKIKKFKLNQSQSIIFVIVIAILFLGIGVEIGNGRLQLFYNSITNKFSSQNGNLGALNYSAIQQEYNIIKQDYDGKLTTQQLQNGIQQGLANAAGDPYTEFFDASDAKNFNNELNNTFSGIGAELGTNSQGDVIIVAPIAGFPAAKAGLLPNDVVASVNGKTTTNENIDDVVDAIRGPSGTKVTLGIIRNDNQALNFTITRSTINAPSVMTKIIDGDIGYMSISTFANDTGSLANQAATTFKKDNVKGIVLDLRGDPGGLVTAAVDVSSLWLPSGKTVMTEKHGSQVIQTNVSTGTDTLTGIPTVVLFDSGSASASEITASALHDNGYAYTIGEQSFGKGSVQELEPLDGGAEVKVTIAHWYTPDNKNINKVGLKPDEVVNYTAAEQKVDDDTQLNAAIQYLQNHFK